MTTAPVREKGTMPITTGHIDHNGKEYYTVEEFMDELARQLGEMYGLNDIREAQ